MKKTRLIPFDYEKYKTGAKAVFRNFEATIIDVLYFPNNEIYKFLCIYNKKDDETEIQWLNDRGYFGLDDIEKYDLLLEEEYEEPEQKTVWINDYASPIPKDCLVTLHNTLEAAQYYSEKYCLSFRGRLKVTYTDEDLIK